MNLIKTIKDLRELAKGDSLMEAVLMEVFQRLSEDLKSKSADLRIDDVMGMTTTKYRNLKTGKALAPTDYYDLLREVRVKKGEDGHNEFVAQYESFYDAPAYAKELANTKRVAKELEKLGFKTKVQYDKNFENTKNPETMWISISW